MRPKVPMQIVRKFLYVYSYQFAFATVILSRDTSRFMLCHPPYWEVIMGRVSRVHGHASKEEIEALLRTEEGRKHSDKLLVVLNAMVDPRPAREIAMHLNVSVHSVHAWVSVYNRLGVGSLFGPGPGGRRNQHMTKEEEGLFLGPFFEKAGKGEIATVAEIRESLEEHLGHPLHHSVVYRFLDRNGWRRIKPWPGHVKGNKEKQEDFKKKNSQPK
jgi:transposase